MSDKSPLTEALERWTIAGGNLGDTLPKGAGRVVKSKAEALAICSALDALRANSVQAKDGMVRSTLHVLATFFQDFEGDVAFETLRNDGVPRLQNWVNDALSGKEIKDDDCLFIMKILAMYRRREDVDLIVRAARKPIAANGFMWSVIFRTFGREHPGAADLVDALRDPLPLEFIAVAYLDFVNHLILAGTIDSHPFDSAAGWQKLDYWLRDTDERYFSYATSATVALPYIEKSVQSSLLSIAAQHPKATVRLEAAWVRAKIGDEVGFDQLTEFCLDPCYCKLASKYLDELGRSDLIPSDSKTPDSQAIAEMASWLSHPMEFGRPPDAIELLDTRELFWPPTNDRRQVWLIKYMFRDKKTGETESGVGMVGSITFALFGQSTADLAPEDIYGLHCSWEMRKMDRGGLLKSHTAQAGREILREHNVGF